MSSSNASFGDVKTLKDGTMRKLGLMPILAAASLSVAGCATYPNQYGYDPYGPGPGYSNSQGANVAAGAAVGAVGGAIASKALGGSAVTGAVAGAVLGGVLGATINGHQYYRDTRGYCYYVDQYGQPHYSYDIRC